MCGCPAAVRGWFRVLAEVFMQEFLQGAADAGSGAWTLAFGLVTVLSSISLHAMQAERVGATLPAEVA